MHNFTGPAATYSEAVPAEDLTGALPEVLADYLPQHPVVQNLFWARVARRNSNAYRAFLDTLQDAVRGHMV